eukprot:scaffold51377_cov78-Phaeocystis_antarctica.AAC.2
MPPPCHQPGPRWATARPSHCQAGVGWRRCRAARDACGRWAQGGAGHAHAMHMPRTCTCTRHACTMHTPRGAPCTCLARTMHVPCHAVLCTCHAAGQRGAARAAAERPHGLAASRGRAAAAPN